jgi:DNA-binding NtrC family response regulator
VFPTLPSHSAFVATASILISEADPDVRRLLTVLMERLGYEAVALDRHVEVPPRADLLLVEPLAPWCVEQAKLARMFFPELPIVCMGQIPDGTEFPGHGVVALLEKPFTVQALETAVSALAPSPV